MTARQKLLSDLDGLTYDDWHEYHSDTEVQGIAIDAFRYIRDNPEIVRCKNCIYCYAEGFVYEHNVCSKHEEIEDQPDDWYCPDGEVKQDE